MMEDKNFVKIKPVQAMICKLIGHQMKQTDEVQLTHEMGNDKVRGYAGRVKEIATRHQCERCNKTTYTKIYVEMDNYDTEMVPETSLVNPMKAHLDMAYKMKAERDAKQKSKFN